MAKHSAEVICALSCILHTKLNFPKSSGGADFLLVSCERENVSASRELVEDFKIVASSGVINFQHRRILGKNLKFILRIEESLLIASS